MGLFDSVMVACPDCEREVEFQTKADIDPCMSVYRPPKVPHHLLESILWEPECCKNCGTWFVVTDKNRPVPAEPPPIQMVVMRIKRPPDAAYADNGLGWYVYDHRLTADQFTDDREEARAPPPWHGRRTTPKD